MRDFADDYGWSPPGARPHVAILVRAPQFVAACAAALAAWRPDDWAEWLCLVPDEQLHITLAWADRLSATLTEQANTALVATLQEHVADVRAFDLVLGPLREVTYGVELDVDAAADAQLAELSARCRRALREVCGTDVVSEPDPRWTYPHVALAYGRRTGSSDLLAGWLAHTRTATGERPRRLRVPVAEVVLMDADTFAPGGPTSRRPIRITLAPEAGADAPASAV